MPEPVGIEGTVTEKAKKSGGFGHCMEHTGAAIARGWALPRLSVCSSHPAPTVLQAKVADTLGIGGRDHDHEQP